MVKILYAWYIVVDFAIIHKHPIPLLIDDGACPVLYIVVLSVHGKFLLVALHRLHRCAYTILLGLFLGYLVRVSMHALRKSSANPLECTWPKI